jgi:hypothetical protein
MREETPMTDVIVQVVGLVGRQGSLKTVDRETAEAWIAAGAAIPVHVEGPASAPTGKRHDKPAIAAVEDVSAGPEVDEVPEPAVEVSDE